MGIRRHVIFCGALVFLGSLQVCSAVLAGTVSYDAESLIVWVRDFPEEAPATMDDILAADQGNGWKITEYDQTTDTYRLEASLDIGSDEGLGTFFQLGRKLHPRETLIVRGDVWIRPPRVSRPRSDGRPRVVNRLTLGDPGDAGIQATLKIDCSKPKEFGLGVGWRAKDPAENAFRGDLHAYNSAITAATPNREHLVAGWIEFEGVQTCWFGSDIRLINATISWITGIYGAQSHNSVFEGTTFEHGDEMIQNGRQVIRHCVFRDLQAGVCEGGCLDATVIGCRFSDNESNWSLGGGQSGIVTGGIEMIDSEIGPQRKPVDLRKNDIKPDEAVRSHVPIYPTYTELASLVVKVADAAGQPIPDAWVNVSCDSDVSAVRRGLALTDEQGLTPADPEGHAILVTTRKLQATDTPGQPHEFSFRYEVTVQAHGFAPQHLSLSHDQQLPKPLTVTLTRN